MEKKRTTNARFAWTLSVAITVLLFTSCIWCIPSLRTLNYYTTISSYSPNERHRVDLQEQHWSFIDRNFRLLLRDTESSLLSREIFSSPDEGRPAGTERIAWSSDDRYFLLIGRHFYVHRPKLVTTEGELVYLVADAQSDEIFCNADQWPKEDSITPELLARLGFSIATHYEIIKE